MVVDRKTRSVIHAQFEEMDDTYQIARAFRNNAAVLKAHIERRSSGGKVISLLQPAEDALTWWCIETRQENFHLVTLK